jgi:hypothetical protein
MKQCDDCEAPMMRSEGWHYVLTADRKDWKCICNKCFARAKEVAK